MSSPIKAWLLLGGIFIVGVVTGVGLTVSIVPRIMRAHGEAEMRERMMPFLTQRLDLTADQKSKIKPIVQELTGKIQSLHRDEVDQGAKLFKAANEQIMDILTPDQKVQLQKLEQERDKMFKGHIRPWAPQRDGPGGPPDGGPQNGPGGMFQRPDMNDHMAPPAAINAPVHVPPPPAESGTSAPHGQ
jgi:hypothetical protein